MVETELIERAIADPQDPLLSPVQAARLIGEQSANIQSWLRRGLVPCVRTPLGRLVRKSDLLQFVERTGRASAGRQAQPVGRP
jgi:hypothetical protein